MIDLAPAENASSTLDNLPVLTTDRRGRAVSSRRRPAPEPAPARRTGHGHDAVVQVRDRRSEAVCGTDQGGGRVLRG